MCVCVLVMVVFLFLYTMFSKAVTLLLMFLGLKVIKVYKIIKVIQVMFSIQSFLTSCTAMA